MAKFFYVARDGLGKKVSGVEEGSTSDEIINRLQSRDLIVITVAADYEQDVKGLREEIVAQSKAKLKHYRVTPDDLVLFCRQLATLLGAGVTILKSLEIICMQVTSFKLYNVIRNLQKNMEAGLSLHEAMAKHPLVFSELWVNLVESGEASGNLAVVLNRLANYLERNAAFKRKLISAILYPIILMVAGLGALLFLTVRIIPTFAELFKGFDITLPLLTRMLISTSLFIKKFFLLLIGLLVVGAVLFRRYIKTKEGRKKFEQFQFRLPVFGEMFRALVVERFSSEMSTLVESGVPILYSLEIAEHSVGNLVMSEVVRKIKDEVREGKPLNQPLAKSGFFEPMVVQMVTIGEEIGELSPMFKKINAFYQEYVETFLARFATIFEPFMLVFMGIIIGIIVIGMFLPIFQISQISG
ncbi:MAG: type II secretion system F family protein [Candidatus Omnitrophica bacterium]|nr:type II secretion system F family protein [Candidatus Omnitrophota bacterium]MDD5512469.1 type II secretion system F family protein [Candidatus Omnitrophota bacterium]